MTLCNCSAPAALLSYRPPSLAINLEPICYYEMFHKDNCGGWGWRARAEACCRSHQNLQRKPGDRLLYSYHSRHQEARLFKEYSAWERGGCGIPCALCLPTMLHSHLYQGTPAIHCGWVGHPVFAEYFGPWPPGQCCGGSVSLLSLGGNQS